MPVAPFRLWKRLGAVLRADSGMAVLELALLMPIFLSMVFAIIEMGLLLLTQSALDIATRKAARLIETGQVQLSGGSDTLFRSALCSVFSSPLMNCAGLIWTVQSGASFGTLLTAIQGNSTPGSSSFSPGTAGENVVVRVQYTQPLVLPLVAQMLSGGSARLSSITAFQNEVYQ